MYTQPFTTSVSIRPLSILTGCLQLRKIAHDISFYFLSKAFYLFDIVGLCARIVAMVYCKEQKETILALW